MTPFDPTLPLEKARTLPSDYYTDPAAAAAERRHVFGDNWLVVGRSDQVANPGQFFTADVAGEPLVIVRGDDGLLRGFFNVCRHHAARVACEAQGEATKLRCPYHGWTYDLTGALRGVPEFDGVQDFRREDNGLVPVTVDAWGHFVFAHLGKPAVSLRDSVAPLPERLANFGLTGLRWYARRTYDLACNWKVYVDNYLDGGYHVNYLHPSLAGVLDYKHYRTDTYEWCSVQSSPLKAPDAGADTSAASVRTGTEAAYCWLYPNFMVNAYGGVMDTNLVLPLAPDRCRVVFDFYFPPDDSDAAARFRDESVRVADQVQAEDVGICEDVQRGLASRAYTTGRYSVRRENGMYHFHQLLARQVGS
jgi:choline monooxygenase